MIENWKDIEGYEGSYMISNHGRVKSMKREAFNGFQMIQIKERIMKPCLNRGYVYVTLCKDGVHKSLKVHRLVAISFLNNPNNDKYVDHIDGDKSNNKSFNLRWVTHKENVNNPNTLKKQSSLQLNNKSTSKKVNQISIETGCILNTYPSVMEASRQTGIDSRRISDVCLGKRDDFGGYAWKYNQ